MLPLLLSGLRLNSAGEFKDQVGETGDEGEPEEEDFFSERAWLHGSSPGCDDPS